MANADVDMTMDTDNNIYRYLENDFDNNQNDTNNRDRVLNHSAGKGIADDDPYALRPAQPFPVNRSRPTPNEQLATLADENGMMLLASNSNQLGTSPKSRTKCMCHVSAKERSNVSLDDVEIIELDDFNLDDEDEWLHSTLESQKKKKLSPYKWVRQEFDVSATPPRNTLLDKLHEVATRRDSRSLVSSFVESPSKVCESVDTQTESIDTQTDDVDVADDNCASCSQENYNGKYEINTRTFTRPKKSKNNNNFIVKPIELGPDFSDESQNGTPRSVRREPPTEKGARLVVTAEISVVRGRPDARIGGSLDDVLSDQRSQLSPMKLEDVTDVQVLARMQEDNLRKSYSSVRKPLRRPLTNSTGRLSDGPNNGGQSYRSNRSSLDDKFGATNSANSLTSSSSGSYSSPPESMADVSRSGAFAEKPRGFAGGSHQRSLPNLSKSTTFRLNPSLPTDPDLYALSIAPQHQPTPRSPPPTDPQPSVRAFSPPARSNAKRSIPVTTSPRPKASDAPDRPKAAVEGKSSVSGIPKPNFVSRLRPPSQTKKNLSMLKKNDGNWREGCF